LLKQKIANSRNPKELRTKIDECLRLGKVDYIHGALPKEIFYSRLSEIGLSTDDATNLHAFFVCNDYPLQARIYLNPSQRYYGDLMQFLIGEAAKQELDFGIKSRMSGISSNSCLDNLIIYTYSKDLGKIIYL